ncbi:TWiK family of potassium channels protein [Schistosoma japonicum]|uniref:TWiK family of potassium channels protein n=1 Tax=Schistosoma japonicum TaxID=6182 RepID=A0A4Z2DXY2_SCHJA|nr:TWiK family of potassium channels protein [Schistosoma japonicum]
MMNKTELTNDLNFTSKTITTDVIDEYGNAIVSSVRTNRRHSGRYCMKLLMITIKNIGLTLLLIGYLCSGGYIFRSLELYNEAQDCYQRQNTYFDKLNSTTLRIIGTIKSLNIDQLDNTQKINEIIMTLLNNYADELYALDVKRSKNCSTILNTSDGAKWNLINSIFFCVTVITTIGYGHIAPVTFWGRITCIIYAIIGIPLMLIYLAIIGRLLARGFRIIFLNLFCCRCFYDILKRKREQRRKRLREWEESLREHEEEEARRRGLPLPPKKIQSNDEEDDDDGDYLEIDDEDENMEGAKLHVPLTVSVIVLSIYTLFGAMLFPTWEDWS